VRAVVASRGRAERIIEEERFGGIDEGDSSGNLYQCFNVQGELIVNYCTTPAFG